jgi:hypothetical protein
MENEIKYFKKENDFLKSLLDTTGKVYSVIECMDHIPITPEILLTKRFTRRYLSSKSYGGKLTHSEGIFENPAGIFLYLSKMDVETTYKIKVIYDVSQLDEVSLFIKQLIKLN